MLVLTDSRHCPRSPTSWIDIFVDIMSPDLLRLHLKLSPGLHLDVVTTDPHPITHSTICDEADRFRRFVVDDIKLSPIRGDAFPTVSSRLNGL